jgi:serine/threonine protein phosphatase PrpC
MKDGRIEPSSPITGYDNLFLACIFDGHGGIHAVKYLEQHFTEVFLV